MKHPVNTPGTIGWILVYVIVAFVIIAGTVEIFAWFERRADRRENDQGIRDLMLDAEMQYKEEQNDDAIFQTVEKSQNDFS